MEALRETMHIRKHEQLAGRSQQAEVKTKGLKYEPTAGIMRCCCSGILRVRSLDSVYQLRPFLCFILFSSLCTIGVRMESIIEKPARSDTSTELPRLRFRRLNLL